MEAQVGQWYLCEDYINEPVQVNVLERDRMEVRYLISGKLKWLGYPRIWQACRPHLLPFELGYDPATRTVSLLGADGSRREQSLAGLRELYLPRRGRPRPLIVAPPQPAGWDDDGQDEDLASEDFQAEYGD